MGAAHIVRHVVIRGRVQRVGYRAWTEHVALQRGLEGWVRNRADGSVASLAVLGDPDIALITLTELCEQMRRMSRAAVLPVLVDADHGYGNALNVRRTVQELEAAGAAGLTIEDTLLPQAFGQAKTQLISLDEGVGKMKAALDGRGDPSLVIIGRTGAVSITGLDDAIARAKAYEAIGVDALFFTGIKNRSELEAISAATRLPIVLGGAPEEMTALDYLISQRVRIALQSPVECVMTSCSLRRSTPAFAAMVVASAVASVCAA